MKIQAIINEIKSSKSGVMSIILKDASRYAANAKDEMVWAGTLFTKAYAERQEGDEVITTGNKETNISAVRRVLKSLVGKGQVQVRLMNSLWIEGEIEPDTNTIQAMQDLAGYINAADEWPADVEDIIEQNGWVSDCGTEWGVCHNGDEKVIVNENGEAIVVPVEKNTIHLYLINMHEAYMAAEQGVVAVRNLPTDTINYKHEVFEESDVELPTGFTIEKTQGDGEEIFNGDEGADMITELINGKYVTSLVTSNGIVTIKVWNHKSN